jgi:hypothetical protein
MSMSMPHTPNHISKICRYSSCLFLIPGTFNFLIGFKINALVLYGLVLTSQMHWSNPVEGSFSYKIDRVAIVANVITAGVNVKNHLAPIYSLYYWASMTMAYFVFAHSNYIYSQKIRMNVCHQYTGQIDARNIITNCTDYTFTQPNTAAREESHYTCVLIHAIGVHFLTALTGTILCVACSP